MRLCIAFLLIVSSYANAQSFVPLDALPASCITGQSVILTTAVEGRNQYVCTAANVWTLQAATKGSSGTIQTSDGSGGYGSPLNAPASAIVGVSDTQTLINKTLGTIVWNGTGIVFTPANGGTGTEQILETSTNVNYRIIRQGTNQGSPNYTPFLRFQANSGTGSLSTIDWDGSIRTSDASGSTIQAALVPNSTHPINLASDRSLGFGSTTSAIGTIDSGMSRCNTAILCAGNGTPGDYSGTYYAAAFQLAAPVHVASLPTCGSATLGSRRLVDDATSGTPGTAAAGGSGYKIAVQCVYTGSAYAWNID